MSNTVFLVKCLLTKSSDEKAIIYNGTSASEAFKLYNRFVIESCIEVQMWENGQCVQVIEKENLKEAFLVEVSYFGSNKVCSTESEALKIYNQWIDDVYDSKEINDIGFKTKVTIYRIDNVTKTKTIFKQQTIICEVPEDCI